MPQPARGTVELRNVHFVYPTRPDVSALNGVSFSLAKGETVALVGPSGAGKSTILSLILRFYDAQRGQVLVDGLPVDQVDPHALRARLALVPQETALLDDTVLENIRYGRTDASIEAVRRAAIAAHADAFVRALPDGYDTRLGERGTTLSGGQRQRIALARALVRRPRLLLLDDATSSLDPTTEALILTGLGSELAGVTTVIVASRPSTIALADEVVFLADGRVVAQGRHDDLFARIPAYRHLAEAYDRDRSAA
jgi:ATP-binding cassette subfamily B protein